MEQFNNNGCIYDDAQCGQDNCKLRRYCPRKAPTTPMVFSGIMPGVLITYTRVTTHLGAVYAPMGGTDYYKADLNKVISTFSYSENMTVTVVNDNWTMFHLSKWQSPDNGYNFSTKEHFTKSSLKS